MEDTPLFGWLFNLPKRRWLSNTRCCKHQKNGNAMRQCLTTAPLRSGLAEISSKRIVLSSPHW